MSQHAFDQRPHRTLLVLSVPVLLSLIAEPLTALVDTAFVSELGDGPMAALGVGTTLLSAVFWIFNFLSVGTQSEVARFAGAGQLDRARDQNALALTLAGAFGIGGVYVVTGRRPAACARACSSPHICSACSRSRATSWSRKRSP